jgi:hypothetical protein
MNQKYSNNISKEEMNYLYNSVILDIYNNWDVLNDLMFRYINGLLKKISQWDKEMLEFIQKNNIRMENYEDKDIFLENNLRNN